MFTFPNLHNFYGDWRKDLESKGVEFRLQTNVTEILKRNADAVTLQTRPVDPNTEHEAGEASAKTESFDQLILCVLADEALKILGRTASIKEKFVLGGARFFDDITITHSDSEYFQKHYETRFDPELCAKPTSKAQEDQIAFSKGKKKGGDDETEPAGYRPMYYTKSYNEDPRKIEMSFDCTNYQHQFRGNDSGVSNDRHIFQSIFLDKSHQDLWTLDEIDESKIIEKKWWHQLG
jgi:hypothetical protein